MVFSVRGDRPGDPIYHCPRWIDYFDQFGGPAGKKYMKRRFHQLIQGLQSFDFTDHKSKLENEFSTWQGDLPQVDDVLVIGIKV